MKLKYYIPLLKTFDLFKNLTEKDFYTFFNENNHRISNYPKKTLIYLQNEKCNTLDIILEGALLIQNVDENGNILTINIFETGSKIGGNLLFCDQNNYPMNVSSIEDSTLLHIKKDLILSLCQYNYHFLYEFMRDISNKAFMLGNKLKTISMKTIREQIIEFLTYEYFRQNSLKISLNMTKKEWAERLGIHRPSLSRELAKMQKEGLIEYDRNSITIKNKNIITK
ncbi:cAMP-binding domain of CRP or a regulatory subunit of cAMP-dependent protein kinases [Caminicella sporogenes DSM 14501]|uniref:cAMP-binding domain of CRP or a regulatory subunit of cAMP-dependent protein kinases n=1 Tax=Caminicella sporogenes DSM 14501 TaxID=1121266 RepID=A0A1M6SL53_9FIRM|nr:Crp/Fnr family transcriptional regulator [Caminicella sporogenes]RKD26529.1 transcriptional regulator [Caminicella sporogenes]SHK45423.1 cAMP-binding domain of CRP or a regulatory subunit of cAMP-dependent protein kinases [Caminicella sporogenes DSM 14501]